MALFSKTHTIHLDIEGMTCGNCVKHVTAALEAVPGTKKAKVDLAKAHADVEATPDTQIDALVRAVEAAGYRATPTGNA